MRHEANDETSRRKEPLTRRLRRRATASALLYVMLSAGCASFIQTHDSGMLSRGYIPPSIALQAPLADNATLKIGDLISEPPNDRNVGSAIKGVCSAPMMILPVISALIPPFLFLNYSSEGGFPTHVYHLGKQEAGELLAESVARSGLFASVCLGGDQYDYEVRGNVNFMLTDRVHNSGLGILAIVPLWSRWVPSETVRMECRADLELLRHGQTNAILARTYCESNVRRFTESERGELEAFRSSYGPLFSPIVRKFVDDLAPALAPCRTQVGKTKSEYDQGTERQAR